LVKCSFSCINGFKRPFGDYDGGGAQAVAGGGRTTSDVIGLLLLRQDWVRQNAFFCVILY
jgi:hypothetical protein